MRPRFRIAAYMLLAMSGVTCTDGPTSPSRSGGPTTLRLAPMFSLQAQQIAKDLSAFGLTVDNIHIHIDHPPATPFDTVISIPAGADSIALNLPVILNSTTEQLNVHIELRQGNTVLYSGTQTITATVGAVSSSSTSTVPINYVGPGATLTNFAIAPHDTAILVSGNVPFRLTATDNNGAAVIGLDVHWTVANAALGSVDASSSTFAPSGTSGTTFVIASTPNGLRDSATVTVSAPPAKLALVSGGGQSAAAGSSLAQPVVVQVQSTNGAPVAGVVVTFAPGASGATSSPTSAVSAVTGDAQTSVTLGHAAGIQTITASAAGLPTLTISETAVAGSAAQIAKVSGDAQSDTTKAKLPLPFVVRVSDAFGNGVSGVSVAWARTAGAGTLSAATSVTDSTGQTSVGYTMGATPGTDTVTASASGVTSGLAMFVAIGSLPAAAIIIKSSGDRQIALVGTTLPQPLVVKATDSTGHPIRGTVVAWTVGLAGGTVDPATSITDSLGLASTTFTLPTAVGFANVNATLPNHASVAFTEQGSVPVVGSLRFVVQPTDVQSMSIICPFIQVEVLDGTGHRDTTGTSANATVTLDVLHGPANGHVRGADGFAPDTVQAVRGLATFHVGDDIAGVYKLIANSSGLKSDSSAAYTVSVGPASQVHIVAGQTLTGVAFDTTDIRPTVVATDAGGNPIAGVSLTWKIDQGGGGLLEPNADAEPTSVLCTTSASDGKSAVFWYMGGTASQSMYVYLSGGIGTDSAFFALMIDVPPSQMQFTNSFNETYASGTHVPLVVQLQDADGNPVAKAGVPIGLFIEFGCFIGGDRAPAGNRASGGQPKFVRVRTPATSRGTARSRSASLECDRAPNRAPAFSRSAPGTKTQATLRSGRIALGVRAAGVSKNVISGPPAVHNSVPFQSGQWDTLPCPPDPTMIGDSIVVTDAQGRATFSNLNIAGYAWEDFQIVAYDTTCDSPIESTNSPVLDLTPGALYSVLAAYDSVHQVVSQHVVDFPLAVAIDSVGNGVPSVALTLSATGGGVLDSTHVTTDGDGYVAITGWQLGASSGVNTVTATGSTAGPHNAATLIATAHQAGALRVSGDPPESSPQGAAFDPVIQVSVTDSTGTWDLNAAGVVITPSVVLAPPGQDASTPTLVGNTGAFSTAPDGSAGFDGLGVDGSPGSTVVVVFTAPGLQAATTIQITLQGSAPLLTPLAALSPDPSRGSGARAAFDR